MPAILQSSVWCKMSSEKENSKSDDMKEEEKDTKDESTVDSKEDTDDKSAEESEEKEKESSKRKPAKVKESKKEVKSEDDEDEDEDEDGDDEEDEDEADGDDKGNDKAVPLLDQPLELSGTRERKKVQRFTEEFKSEPKDAVVIEIPEGKGAALGSIPRIEASIQTFRPDALKPLHRVLFGRVGKITTIKKNIRKFNGFDFQKDSDQFEKKKHMMQKLEMRLLRMLCSVLDVEKKGNREEIADRLMNFLLEPKDSGKPPPARRPKRSAAKANNKSYSESDDDDEKRPSRTKRGKGKRSTLKDTTSSEDEKDVEDEEDEKDKESDGDEDDESLSDDDSPKKRKGRSKGSKSNAKKSSAKKSSSKKTPSKKAEKKTPQKKRKSPSKSEDDSSSEDEPLAKKAKAPPTDDEIKTYVKEILEGANLEEITMKTVCKQVYAHYPDFDLAHKKDFIKTTVKSLIST